MPDSPVRVAVTGAAGQIGYALLFRIASGQMFGPDYYQLRRFKTHSKGAQEALKKRGQAPCIEDA